MQTPSKNTPFPFESIQHTRHQTPKKRNHWQPEKDGKENNKRIFKFHSLLMSGRIPFYVQNSLNHGHLNNAKTVVFHNFANEILFLTNFHLKHLFSTLFFGYITKYLLLLLTYFVRWCSFYIRATVSIMHTVHGFVTYKTPNSTLQAQRNKKKMKQKSIYWLYKCIYFLHFSIVIHNNGKTETLAVIISRCLYV